MHPFHPHSGQQLECVGERYNRCGTHILLEVGDDIICSVPRQWTDLVAPDPEVVIGAGRAVLRLEDVEALAQIVEGIIGRRIK